MAVERDFLFDLEGANPTSPPLARLSARLAAIAAMVPPGLPMADIGTDHGHLPAFLVATGHVPSAIAIDDKAAPLTGARKRCAGLRVELRQASGCAGLSPGEVHTVTVAGMGGDQIVRILTSARAISRFVLQPNSADEVVRSWLADNGWLIDQEHVVSDRGRRFVVLAARLGVRPLTPTERRYGGEAVQVDRGAWRARVEADLRRRQGFPSALR